MDNEDTIFVDPDTSTEECQKNKEGFSCCANSGLSVYVGYLPTETDAETLRVFMAQAGEVANVRIVRDGETGQDKGYAIVDYTDQLAAKNAIENLNGAMIQDRAVHVKLANEI